MISICRTKSGNVKRWRDGQMALRWCAAGMVEAGKQFRCVTSPAPRSVRVALEREVADLSNSSYKMASWTSPELIEPFTKFHGTRDILFSS